MYTPSFYIACNHCAHLKPEFEAVEADYTKYRQSIDFLEINPSENEAFRLKYKISAYPLILLFKPLEPRGSGIYEVIQYGDRRVAHLIGKFIEEQTGLPTTLQQRPSLVLQATPEKLASLLPGKCVILSICSQFDIFCKFLAPRLESLASIYEAEEDVIIATLDGDRYLDYSNQLKVNSYPTIFAFNGGVMIHSEDKQRTLPTLVAFVNEQCKKERQIDGSLVDGYGVDAGMTEAVRDFIQKPELRPSIMSKASPYYLPIMRLVIYFGEAYLGREGKRVEMLLKSSWPERRFKDEYQIRHGIIQQFLKFVPS